MIEVVEADGKLTIKHSVPNEKTQVISIPLKQKEDLLAKLGAPTVLSKPAKHDTKKPAPPRTKADFAPPGEAPKLPEGVEPAVDPKAESEESADNGEAE